MGMNKSGVEMMRWKRESIEMREGEVEKTRWRQGS